MFDATKNAFVALARKPPGEQTPTRLDFTTIRHITVSIKYLRERAHMRTRTLGRKSKSRAPPRSRASPVCAAEICTGNRKHFTALSNQAPRQRLYYNTHTKTNCVVGATVAHATRLTWIFAAGPRCMPDMRKSSGSLSYGGSSYQWPWWW